MTLIDASDIPDAPGTYVLVLQSRNAQTVEVGQIGSLAVRPGFYLYVGSALGTGGLRARVSRYFGGGGKPHWHVDYLRQRTDVMGAWLAPDALRHEHEWADALADWPGLECAMRGFGASDCACETHLFYSPEWPAFGAFQAQLEFRGYSATGLLNVVTACSLTFASITPGPKLPDEA